MSLVICELFCLNIVGFGIMLHPKRVLEKLLPQCPNCKQRLWLNDVKTDLARMDAVERWYQYSGYAKKCSKCNARLRENKKLSMVYVFFMLFLLPCFNGFVSPMVIKEYGVILNVVLLVLMALFVLWVTWLGQKYEIYESPEN